MKWSYIGALLSDEDLKEQHLVDLNHPPPASSLSRLRISARLATRVRVPSIWEGYLQDAGHAGMLQGILLYD